ncbi:hypothetical protein D9M68_05810 [compost metagenome]
MLNAPDAGQCPAQEVLVRAHIGHHHGGPRGYSSEATGAWGLAAAEQRTFLTGIQALVRLPIIQRELDSVRGLCTAWLVSGYRGSH